MITYKVKQIRGVDAAPQPDYFKRRAILNIIAREAELIDSRGSQFRDNLFEEELAEYLEFLTKEGMIYAYAMDWVDDDSFMIKVKIDENDNGENEITLND